MRNILDFPVNCDILITISDNNITLTALFYRGGPFYEK